MISKYYWWVVGPGSSPLAKIVASEGSYTVFMNSPPPGLSSTTLMLGPGEDRHMCQRSQNGSKRGAGPKRPVSVAWGKMGLVGRWIHPKHRRVREVN